MPNDPDVREQLAAWLAGDLGEPEAAELEARMASEPWVATAADELADTVARLGRIDDVPTPRGFSARLRGRLEEEIGHELPSPPHLDASVAAASGAAAANGWAAPRGRTDGRRPGSGRGERVRRAVVGAAAAVAVLVIGSTVVLTGTSDDAATDQGVADAEGAPSSRLFTAQEAEGPPEGGGAPGLSAETVDTAEDQAAEDGALEDAAEAVTEALAAPADDPGEAEDTSAIGTAAAGPAILDLGDVTGHESLGQILREDDAAQALLGRDATTAARLADPYRDEILRAPALTGGTVPGSCLLEVLGGVDDVVPAAAAAATVDGQQRLGYALVRAGGDGALDHIDVWVVDPQDCTVLTVLS